MTKRMLAMEWAMSVEEAIEAEAVAQALCMTTEDFARAYRAFAAREKPVFSEIDVIDSSFLDWPFFEESHRDFARRLGEWAASLSGAESCDDVDERCRALVGRLGRDGWLRAVVPEADGGMLGPGLDVRTLCLAREILAYHEGLADFAFAMQGLGSGAITLFGTEDQKRRYLPPVVRGEAIAAFALSEPEGGSDVAALSTRATADGDDHVRLDGVKTWISNGGIADHYLVFARSGGGAGRPGAVGLRVEADSPGLTVEERIEVISPHLLATLRFVGCRVPLSRRIGASGDGFKVAMATLDVFRSTVGAAALGFARRAMDEGLRHAASRRLFGAPLADLQMTQAALADMGTGVDGACFPRLPRGLDQGSRRRPDHPGRRPWPRCRRPSPPRPSSTGRSRSSGDSGLTKGVKVEELYRDIRRFVTGGIIGWDAEGRLSEGFVAQARGTLENIRAILAEGGAEPAHLVRLTWYVVSIDDYLASLRDLGRAYRSVLGAHYPAMALVQVVRLVEAKALVEIEATAVVPRMPGA